MLERQIVREVVKEKRKELSEFGKRLKIDNIISVLEKCNLEEIKNATVLPYWGSTVYAELMFCSNISVVVPKNRVEDFKALMISMAGEVEDKLARCEEYQIFREYSKLVTRKLGDIVGEMTRTINKMVKAEIKNE